MKRLVKKSVPCSLYDIRGLQEWLDGMALQGLFLVDFSARLDRVSLCREEPRPVRYRLDPELYSDPQSLSIALDCLVRRENRGTLLFGLTMLLFMVLPLLLAPSRWLKELILWESPRYLVTNVFYPVLMAILLIFLIIETRRLMVIRRTLAQGLPLKARRRWNRPRYWAWYIPLCCFILFFPYVFPNAGWDGCGLFLEALNQEEAV